MCVLCACVCIVLLLLEPPVLEGYLYKLKHHPTYIFGSWTYRYLRLDREEESLVYYKRKEDVARIDLKPKLLSMINKIKSVRAIDEWTIQLVVEPDVKYKPDAVYNLRAVTKEEKDKWHEQLETYNKALLVYLIN